MASSKPKSGHDSLPATISSKPSNEAEAETPKMTHDSMVTVRLSEPPTLVLDTAVTAQDELPTPTETQETSKDIPQVDNRSSRATTISTRTSSVLVTSPSSKGVSEDEAESVEEEDRSKTPSAEPVEDEEVNWEKLEKTEDEQIKGDETDNSTELLLARLEQENAKLATNPKSVKVKVEQGSSSQKTRPPSMAQLRDMVTGPTPPTLRYSMLPPPPMTDLEFWAALVKDYQQTAARLPTLLSKKIHKGVPPPLRGVVWQSMSGARDFALEEQYDRFCGESSPYEPLIGKDLGRSFPGVDMFRDPDGDGQRMLGRVLKSFSLYDTKIGYCQGLAFLVGPLLMHMPDKQAFCILVRLMERYDLRACFLPDLSGLHVRIYQFRELLRSNLPELSAHFEELQLDPAYVSQWFLSFFAVTCPLPMLFRIYDVIFAEGASETLMRVALSLMRKNETRLLACSELEDAMQLLLSRGLWDCYGYDADVFVEDFVSLTSEVSRENLSQLEQGYRDSLVAAASVTRASDITTAASRFLGRIWASSTSISPKSATLSPSSVAQPRPLSLLRRSTSKQSIASTLNSMEASSASVTSSTSTDASTVSRDSSHAEDGSSSRESTPVGAKALASPKTINERYLHSQIEDLLTAMSEMQRNHAVLSNQLQKEREDRDEDLKVVRSLLDGLKQSDILKTNAKIEEERESLKEIDEEQADSNDESSEPTNKEVVDEEPVTQVEESKPAEDLSELLARVEDRFQEHGQKRESLVQTKAQLREELSQAKELLSSAVSQTQDNSRRIQDLTQEVASVKDQLRESHARVRSLHQDKQRLEKQVQGMRTRSTASSNGDSGSREADSDRSSKGNVAGLRELKLGRSKSIPSQTYIKRQSSLPISPGAGLAIATPSTPTSETAAHEKDDLLIELAQCKTAEAVAKQEAEEAKQKLEAFRKAHGLAPGETTPASSPNPGAMGVFGRLTGHSSSPSSETGAKPPPTPNGTSSGGGFWGWRR